MHAAFAKSLVPWFEPSQSRAACIAKLRPGRICEGVLTQWIPQEEILGHACGRPLDGYSWKIDSVFHVRDPPATVGLTRSHAHWQIVKGIFGLDSGSIQFSKVDDGIDFARCAAPPIDAVRLATRWVPERMGINGLAVFLQFR